MASPAPPEANDIRRRGKRRLIGAIAIVLLLVVFVPMVLDSEPSPRESGPSLQIPSRDALAPLPPPRAAAKSPSPPVAPLDALLPEVAKVLPEAAQAAAEAQAAVVEPIAPRAAPGRARAPPPAATPVSPSAPVATAPPLEGFAIQVGAFREEDKLRQAREKLAAAGIVHYTERLETASGPLTRLRAGPFPGREAADAALGKVRAVTPEAKVVPLP